MTQGGRITGGTMAATALLFTLWSSPVGSGPLPEDRRMLRVLPAAQPVVSVSRSRPTRQQREADYLELHRLLQQLMKDRRQYRKDLDAGVPAGRLQAQREAIKRDLKSVKQVRLRIQADNRTDRYGMQQGSRHGVRYFR